MNKIDEMAFLGKTIEEAEVMFKVRGIDKVEWVLPKQAITLQARAYPVVFLNEQGRIKEIW